jgi:hypothetical protein
MVFCCPATVLSRTKLPPVDVRETMLLLCDVMAPEDVTEDADTARPAVKLATDTLTVFPLCTIGRTSVPASGVDALVSWEIFLSAMML